jgi:DNA transposase THAP9
MTLKRAMASSSITSGSPNRKTLRAKINILKNTCRKRQAHIRILQRKTHRMSKKIATLKAVLDDLKSKNFINEDIFTVLKDIPGPNNELLRRQIAKIKGSPLPRKYPPELRNFALNLHFFSPKAYAYVRQTYLSTLPHPETLSKWYRSIKGNPGFTEEAFNVLDLKIKSGNNKQLYCNVVIDEMGIRKREIWDPVEKMYHGRVGIPGTNNEGCTNKADNAFVILLVCVNESWKIPIGYFLINGLTGEQKASLMEICLKRVQDTGIFITGITFDGASSNRSMAVILGCETNVNGIVDLKPFFKFGQESICVFYDAVHMIKLVRNAFGEKMKFVDDEGKSIEWKYIKPSYTSG